MAVTVVIGILAVVLIFLYWRLFYFFRDPERKIPEGNNVISPADGTVIYIKKVKKNTVPLSVKNNRKIKLSELTRMPSYSSKEDKYLIGIFMHPTSVHVNRAPVAGVVKAARHFQSDNLPMTKTWMRTLLSIRPFFKGSSYLLENERNTILIKGKIAVAIVQIADIYVNRIRCFVKKGQHAEKGQRIGAILLGSQVDLVLPAQKKVKIKVKEGQYVKAGETVIADL